MTRKVLITGITGQDGSYLSELLIEKNYRVFGLTRRRVHETPLPDVTVVHCDVRDLESMVAAVRDVQPDEIYNLAAQSHVKTSFEEPLETVQTAALGAVNVFEAVRTAAPRARVFQASSSAMFGSATDDDGFQRETTQMSPTSPYAIAKLFAHNMARSYREAYGLFITTGILFNHESPRRPASFVTSKICKEAARIKYGISDRLELGNLDARRDWGHAKDYVRAMWMALQLDHADDFVMATGVDHSVRDVVEYVFGRLGLDAEVHVKSDAGLLRPGERQVSKGDSKKLSRATGWKPEYTFEQMLDEMLEHWINELRPEAARSPA